MKLMPAQAFQSYGTITSMSGVVHRNKFISSFKLQFIAAVRQSTLVLK